MDEALRTYLQCNNYYEVLWDILVHEVCPKPQNVATLLEVLPLVG
jgi:hypothetical protein